MYIHTQLYTTVYTYLLLLGPAAMRSSTYIRTLPMILYGRYCYGERLPVCMQGRTMYDNIVPIYIYHRRLLHVFLQPGQYFVISLWCLNTPPQHSMPIYQPMLQQSSNIYNIRQVHIFLYVQSGYYLDTAVQPDCAYSTKVRGN